MELKDIEAMYCPICGYIAREEKCKVFILKDEWLLTRTSHILVACGRKGIFLVKVKLE